MKNLLGEKKKNINPGWWAKLSYQMSNIMFIFYRQLAMKEEELANEGKEPEVPDFKEIMDMDFALSLYQKEVAEWRNKTPTNLAAMLSRDKLYNLFPEMPQEVLSELLMAHDDNFQATVEVCYKFLDPAKNNYLTFKMSYHELCKTMMLCVLL